MSRPLPLVVLVSWAVVAVPARAVDPVSVFVVEYLLGKLADEVFDPSSGKPDTRLLEQRLTELERNAALRGEMKDELRKLREGVDAGMTRKEFLKRAEEVSKDLAAVRVRLSAVEEKLERLEVENEDLKAGTKNATKPEHFCERGDRLLADKKYDFALANFSVALQLDPLSPDGHVGRSRAYLLMEAWGPLVVSATEGIEKAKWVGARGLTRAEDEALGRMILHWRRASGYRGLKQNERAIEDYTKALSFDHPPKDPIAGNLHFDRGTMYAETGKDEKAVADFTAAIRHNPKERVYFLNRGDVLDRLKKPDEAIADYTAAVKLTPDEPLVYSIRGVAYSRAGEHEKAIADFDVVIKHRPADAHAYYARGTSYYHTKDYDRSIDDLTQAIKIAPTKDAHLNRGLAYKQKGETEKANEDFAAYKRLAK